MSFKRSDIEFWNQKLVKPCKLCHGSGIKKLDEEENGLVFCQCKRQARVMSMLNNEEYGLPRKYQTIKIADLNVYDSEQIKKINSQVKNYITGLSNKNDISPYRNCVISGGSKSGKTSVASVIYRAIICHEYEIYRVRFSQLASLARMFHANSKAFNEQVELRNLLYDAPFLFIDDVDDRGQKEREKLSFNFFDDVFSYRASHSERATIFTIDKNIKINPELLGYSFYNEIYQENVDEDDIVKIILPNITKKKEANVESQNQQKENNKKINQAQNKLSKTKSNDDDLENYFPANKK